MIGFACQYLVFMSLVIAIDFYQMNRFKGIESRPKNVFLDRVPLDEN
jgi:hypothetical protein